MKIYRLIALGLLTALPCIQGISAAPSSIDNVNGISMGIYQSNWHAVKDIFIDLPSETAGQKKWPYIPSAIAGVLAGWAGAAITKEITERNIFGRYVWPFSRKNHNINTRETKEGPLIEAEADRHSYVQRPSIGSPLLTIAAAVGSAVAGWKGVNWLCRYRSLRAAERKQMELVMDSWKTLRGHFPEELLPAFDALYQLKTQNSADYAVNADKTIRFAQQAVRKHFKKPVWTRVLSTLHNLEY